MRKQWLWLAAFVVAWLALRVFWIAGDSGIQSMWEYGFHVTDEGYYLGGGKEMFLWGSFVDLPRGENLNYGYSAGTHWLSYFAHCLFGLSTWTWRIPFVLLYEELAKPMERRSETRLTANFGTPLHRFSKVRVAWRRNMRQAVHPRYAHADESGSYPSSRFSSGLFWPCIVTLSA